MITLSFFNRFGRGMVRRNRPTPLDAFLGLCPPPTGDPPHCKSVIFGRFWMRDGSPWVWMFQGPPNVPTTQWPLHAPPTGDPHTVNLSFFKLTLSFFNRFGRGMARRNRPTTLDAFPHSNSVISWPFRTWPAMPESGLDPGRVPVGLDVPGTT